MIGKAKRVLYSALAAGVGLLALALCFEIVLRFLPVNEGMHTLPVNERNPVLRFEPDRTAQWSKFWNFSMRNVIHVNNCGFINRTDYERESDLPLLALIGDSFIEAVMVPWEKTGAALLEQRLAGTFRVYTFASSGAALSQYLAYAEHARREFHPELAVISLIGNDFDESLLKYKAEPGHHYFVEDDDGTLQLVRVDFAISPLRKLVRRSRLAMYLATNVSLTRAYEGLKGLVGNRDHVGRAPARVPPERIEDSKRGVDAFLARLPEALGIPPDRILLVLDGMRPHLYDPERLREAEASLFADMRRYVLVEGRERGFEVIDLQPIFIRHFRQHGERFEFPHDDHWNALGHRMLAKAVLESRTLSSRMATPVSASPAGSRPARGS